MLFNAMSYYTNQPEEEAYKVSSPWRPEKAKYNVRKLLIHREAGG